MRSVTIVEVVGMQRLRSSRIAEAILRVARRRWPPVLLAPGARHTLSWLLGAVCWQGCPPAVARGKRGHP